MGVILMVIGMAALGYGLQQHLKGKRILAAPFKKTGEIAKNPVSSDPKGLMSTEGTVIPPTTPVLSPVSKTHCLYYEVAITRKWEKTERTQDGMKTTKGSSNVETIKGGAEFGLDDGTGAIRVDASKGGDFDSLKKQGEAGGVQMSDGFLRFGELRIPYPRTGSDDYTLGFEAVEKIVPVGGSLFALGKLENGKLGKPGWRSMMFSTRGRDGLLSATAKKKKVSLIGGGIGAVAAIPLIIFAPAIAPSESHDCLRMLSGVQQRCSDNLSAVDGNAYTWTVDKAGPYSVEVIPPAHKKIPLDAQIVVKDSSGEVVADVVSDGAGLPVVAKAPGLKSGVYTVTVKDVDGDKVSGGFDYELEIRSDAPGAASDAVAAKGAITNDELLARVAELNAACADTWCEGSFNYKFSKLSCDEGRGCAVAFTATNTSTRKNYDSMVVVPGEFKDEGPFNEAVGKALTAWEAHPTNRQPSIAAPSKKVGPAKNVASAGKPKKK